MLARELGRAVFRLAQAQLGSSDVDRAELAAVLGWLRGQKVAAAALRPALIHARIGRHNARALLVSLARLLLAAGYGGLVLCLDYARLAQARRPPLTERSGVYYSKAAVLDAFEVLRFWSGDPLRVPDLRRALKSVGVAGTYTFTPVPMRELARQRTRFLSRLLPAAGYAGWVVLFDEVELIGRYSALARSRSYAELARWVGGDPWRPLRAAGGGAGDDR